ncbi:virginiamycin B lyase family protein [Leifsonia sp. McL0607]|uniref:virginiamycin B lyase family protein n=1 Tax=Leifsonia sp. McL0607 TaxID=3415672 RepID=UPI003CE91245
MSVELFPVGAPGDGAGGDGVRGDGLIGVAATGDGAVWFALSDSGRVGRRDADGTLAYLELGAASQPVGISTATEDTVWVVDRTGGRLVHVGPGIRVIGETAVPSADALPLASVTLPDGTTWFTEAFGDAVGRIDILGCVEEFPVGSEGGPSGITASGESVWFALQGHRPALGHVRGGDAAIELVALPLGSGPLGVAVADDGSVWTALHAADALARVARDRTVTVLPLEEGADPFAVVADDAGGVWASLWGADALVHVTSSGDLERVDLPDGAGPRGLAVAPDGAVWAALVSGELARVRA